MKIDIFQSCHHCWVIQIGWHNECSTLTASSFRILKISAGLFWIILPKVHLASLQDVQLLVSNHAIMVSWVIKTFFAFSVYSYHLFLSPSASVRSLHFLYFIICPLLHEIFPWYLQFFLKKFLVFPILFFPLYLFALFTSESLLLSCCYSLELWLSVGYLFPFLLYLSLLFFPQIFVKLPRKNTLFSCIFSFEMVLITTSFTMVKTFIHTSSATLSTKSNPLNLFITSTV